jgi:hypothetical protein
MSQRTPICWIEEAEARRMVLCDAESRQADRAEPRQKPAAVAEPRGILTRFLSVWLLREAKAC